MIVSAESVQGGLQSSAESTPDPVREALEALGLREGATAQEIEDAYTRQAQEGGKNAAELYRLSGAYRLLSSRARALQGGDRESGVMEFLLPPPVERLRAILAHAGPARPGTSLWRVGEAEKCPIGGAS